MLSYYLFKTMRETLILTEFSAEVRSYATAAITLLLFFVVPLYSVLFRQGNKEQLIRWITLFFASNVLIFYMMGKAGMEFSFLYYIWVGIFGVMMIAQFWAFAADHFNIKTGQRLFPIIMAGNGVIRSRATGQLVDFAEKLNIPVATTFMAKGAIPFSHSHSLGTVGLQAHDYVACGFDRADVIICVGYDMVEYHPYLWHKDKDRKIVHLDTMPAEVDEHYILEVGVVGCIKHSLAALAESVAPKADFQAQSLRKTIVDELAAHAADDAFPMKPQRIIWDLRKVLEREDIVISDVGAHKMWMARMYQAEAPNTCIISNGFASMGIGVPGAIAAKLVSPNQTALTVTGDAGFMMNSQEIETALRIGTPIIILSAFGTVPLLTKLISQA
ncbi:MAG: hypothetical protein IIA33_08745 [Planctomycetes bacterium]|nr:hypothetical protein [Planctomycetota bacterium]